MTLLLLVGAFAAILLGVGGGTFRLFIERPPESPRFGRRGRSRKLAQQERTWFRLLEPTIRFTGSRVDPLIPRKVSWGIERRLLEAGYPLGISAGELMAGALAMAALGSVVLLLAVPSGSPLPVVLLGSIAAGAIPFARLSSVRRTRSKRITRSLPSVLELVVMCMSAGLDLPRALRCVVDSATDPHDPIVEELETVVRELELGRTRRDALLGLADRVKTAEVKELVNSIIQSEEKGASLTRALIVQSRTLKLRRSMNAEQAASGAALMLVGPMSLIFLCVIALLLGPVVIRTTLGGLGS